MALAIELAFASVMPLPWNLIVASWPCGTHQHADTVHAVDVDRGLDQRREAGSSECGIPFRVDKLGGYRSTLMGAD
jgi:hypothetical protein